MSKSGLRLSTSTLLAASWLGAWVPPSSGEAGRPTTETAPAATAPLQPAAWPQGADPPWAASSAAGALLQDYEAGVGWRLLREANDVRVYTRVHPGSRIKEGVAVGVVPAPPCAVLAALTDHPRLPEYLPLVALSLLKHRQGRQEWYCQYLDLPWPLKDRKYNLHGVHHDLSHGSDCELLLRWRTDDRTHPCDPDDYRSAMLGYRRDSITLAQSVGYWHLTGTDGSRATRAVLYLFADPGGSVPATILNWFVDDAVTALFRGVREASHEATGPNACPCRCGAGSS